MTGATTPQRPIRLLFIQTQAEMAGAQEISRLLGSGLGERRAADGPEYDIHHLFFYRKTTAFDGWPNVHFCAEASPTTPLAFARFFRRLVRTIREVKPDVVLTFQHYGNVFGAPAARLAGVRAVIANHVSAPGVINATTRRLDRLAGLVGAYDLITVNSHATMADYQAYPARYSRRLVHVPHGFDNKAVAVSQREARDAFGLPPDVPLLGSVARLHPMKQLDAAIRVLPIRPDWHLAIAGQGVDGARLRTLATQLGVAERVRFAGDLLPARVGLFLASLDVFVFPTLAESFGLAAVEAAQAGIPVVANDLPVLREVLEVEGEPCALFAEAADTASFAEAIDRVFDDADLRRCLIARGRRLADAYSVSAMTEAYATLIRQVMGGATPTEALPGQSAQAQTPVRRA